MHVKGMTEESGGKKVDSGAPARFCGRVGGLKKRKDSAQKNFFALPTLDFSLPT